MQVLKNITKQHTRDRISSKEAESRVLEAASSSIQILAVSIQFMNDEKEVGEDGMVHFNDSMGKKQAPAAVELKTYY